MNSKAYKNLEKSYKKRRIKFFNKLLRVNHIGCMATLLSYSFGEQAKTKFLQLYQNNSPIHTP